MNKYNSYHDDHELSSCQEKYIRNDLGCWQYLSPQYVEHNEQRYSDGKQIHKLWKRLLELYNSTLVVHWTTSNYQLHLVTDKLYKKLIKKLDMLSEIITDNDSLKVTNLTIDTNLNEYISFLDHVASKLNERDETGDRAIDNILDEIQTEIRKHLKMLRITLDY